MRIITVANQKGGVGKTTTSVNLAAALALEGKQVVLLDLDPQANATSNLGVNGDSYPATIYEAILGTHPIRDAVARTDIKNLSVVPSTRRLVGAELELAGMDQREYRLKQEVHTLAESFDFVIIDCPPSLGLLTLNALTATHSVLIPIQCEYFALEGLGSLMHTIRLVQSRLNPKLYLEGVLLTMYDHRLNLARQVAEEARRYFGDRVYDAVIPRNVRVSEAPSFGKPVLTYDPKSAGSTSFVTLAKEVLRNVEEGARAGLGRVDPPGTHSTTDDHAGTEPEPDGTWT